MFDLNFDRIASLVVFELCVPVTIDEFNYLDGNLFEYEWTDETENTSACLLMQTESSQVKGVTQCILSYAPWL